MAQPIAAAVFYHHERWDCYECMGCHELLEVPFRAVLRNGREREPVKRDAENRVLWLELRTLEHNKCAAYKDELAAANHRRFGLHLVQRMPRGDEGPTT